MDIAAPDYTSGSRVDRQPQKIAPTATFAGDHPVASSHFGVSDATKSVSLGDSDCLRTTYTMRSSINARTMVDGEALRSCARNHTWCQIRKEYGTGHQDER